MSDQTPIPTETPAAPPASPFDRVPAPLREALEGRGFRELTAVQIAALDAIDGSRDLRISSQTGSGKTVALGLAIAPVLIARAATAARTGPDALIIVPTRELAAQVHKELEWLFARVSGVRIDSVTGGTPVGQERRRLARRPRILVGTPGRLVDHIGSGALDCENIGQLVLDEADQMLDLGFRDDLDTIIGAIPAAGRRTHMLSATFPPSVRQLTAAIQSDPLHVEGTRLGDANADISHVGHVVRPHDRYGALVNLLLLAGDERTLIFVATRADAGQLAEKLAGDGFSALPLSGDLAQAQRTRTLNAFRTGAVAVLVATDVAARGLDVPEVSMVVHGDLPMDGEVYTHRSGRTGRAGRKGRSVLLALPHGERRARFIFRDAGVDAEWRPVPTAAEVDKALVKRSRRRVRKSLEAPAEKPSDAELEFARSLLDGGDPVEITAALIAGLRCDRVREPFDVQPPAQRREPKLRAKDSRTGDAPFTRFRINWGFRHGANPRRLLAALCRRGGVKSNVIGAIDIDPHSATFDVQNHAAREFERRALRNDPRDPQHRIERVRNGSGRAAARGRAG